MCGSCRAVSNRGHGSDGGESKHYHARLNFRCSICINHVTLYFLKKKKIPTAGEKDHLLTDGIWILNVFGSMLPYASLFNCASTFCCINCNAVEMCKSSLLPTVGEQFPHSLYPQAVLHTESGWNNQISLPPRSYSLCEICSDLGGCTDISMLHHNENVTSKGETL